MKPLYLSIEGINSFTTKQEIDFEALSYERIFCICGSTGSGKTTILDSIIIALFAPRSYTRGALKEYINSGVEKGEIVFRFDFEDKVYEVKRLLKQSGASGVLKRLDTNEILADQTEKVTDMIVKMLNITCDDFTKIVVLEQGKYNKFMVTGGDERNKFLAKLFNYSRFEGLKEKFKKIADTLEKTDKEYKEKIDSANITKGDIEGWEKQKIKLEKLAIVIKKHQEEITQKRIAITQQKSIYEDGINARKNLCDATSALEGLKCEKTKLENIKADVDTYKTEVIGLENAANFSREKLVRIRECKSDILKKNELEKSKDAMLLKYLEYDKSIKKLTQELDVSSSEKLQDDKKKAQVELEELRKKHAAADVAHLLQKGDKCPVCGGVYCGDFLFSAESGKLKAIEDFIKNLDLRLSQNQKKEVELATLAQKAENIKNEGLRLKNEIADIGKKIDERLGGQNIDELENRANVDIANFKQAEERGKNLQQQYGDLSNSLASKEASLIEKIRATKDVLKKADGVFYEPSDFDKIEAERKQTQLDFDENSKQIIEVSTQLIVGVEKLRLKNECKLQKDKIASKLACALKLKKMFERNSFLEFVSREYIMGFTTSASAILGELTGGKYTLEYDAVGKEFLVRDFLNNNETRKVKTLSGGETFLASLSVAIAISRSLADGKNYEFFFLDEGFGTLHEKAIDTVCSALKKLSESTIVGVVSHRQELIEKISAKIVVSEANEEKGSTINFVCG